MFLHQAGPCPHSNNDHGRSATDQVFLPAVDLQEKGYDPVYGARPVKRAVQRELETALAKGFLRGDFGEDDTVVVDAPGGAQVTIQHPLA